MAEKSFFSGFTVKSLETSDENLSVIIDRLKETDYKTDNVGDSKIINDDHQGLKFLEQKCKEYDIKNKDMFFVKQHDISSAKENEKVNVQVNVGDTTVSTFVNRIAKDNNTEKISTIPKIDVQALVSSTFDELNKSLTSPSRGLSI